MYRVAGMVQGRPMQERFFEGLWLGRRFNSDENIVIKLEDGQVVKTRAVQEIPVKLTFGMLTQVRGQPWQPSGTPKAPSPDETVEQPDFPIEETQEDHAPQTRAMQVTRAMLDKFGLSTQVCHKCRLMARVTA